MSRDEKLKIDRTDGPPAQRVEKRIQFKGLGRWGWGSLWLMAVKHEASDSRAQPKSASGLGCGDQIIQTQIVAEVEPARRRPGNALGVEAFEAGVVQQQLHPLRRNELFEIVRALGDLPQSLA